MLEYLEQNVPLDATFEHLPQADFSSATASSDAIKLRLEFEQDMSRMLEAKKLDFNAVAGEDSPAILEGTVHAIDSQVEVQLFPKKPPPKSDVDSVEDKEKGKGSASKDKRSKWVEAKVIEHDRDATTGEIVYFCWLPFDYDGQKANRSQRFKAEHVRYSALSAYKPAPYLPSEDGVVKSSKLIGSDSPAKSMEEFVAMEQDAILNGYDPVNWPVGITCWQLRQLTKVAQDLNRKLYALVKASITDLPLQESLTEDCEGDTARLVLKARKRFGNNAGVHHIKRAADNSHLAKFTDPTTMGSEVASWVEYHRKTNPEIHRLAVVLYRTDEMSKNTRDPALKIQLQQAYSSKLAPFGRDPVGEAVGLLKELQEELTNIGMQESTSEAVRGIDGGGAKGGKSTNFVGLPKEQQPCIKYFKFKKCPQHDCGRSHQMKPFEEWLKEPANKKFYDDFKLKESGGGGGAGPKKKKKGDKTWPRKKGDKGGKEDKKGGASNSATKTSGRVSLASFMVVLRRTSDDIDVNDPGNLNRMGENYFSVLSDPDDDEVSSGDSDATGQCPRYDTDTSTDSITMDMVIDWWRYQCGGHAFLKWKVYVYARKRARQTQRGMQHVRRSGGTQDPWGAGSEPVAEIGKFYSTLTRGAATLPTISYAQSCGPVVFQDPIRSAPSRSTQPSSSSQAATQVVTRSMSRFEEYCESVQVHADKASQTVSPDEGPPGMARDYGTQTECMQLMSRQLDAPGRLHHVPPVAGHALHGQQAGLPKDHDDMQAPRERRHHPRGRCAGRPVPGAQGGDGQSSTPAEAPKRGPGEGPAGRRRRQPH